MSTDSSATGASVRFNESQDAYELGTEVDGVFVPFVSTPGPQVRSHVENVQAREQDDAAATPPTPA